MCWLVLTTLLLVTRVTELETRRPNIVLIVTDDQDVTMGGTTPMVAARQLIMEQGAEFTNAFATTPICCPSRASILTGRYLHNTGQTALYCIIDCVSILVFY